jgi:hypothetical protein
MYPLSLWERGLDKHAGMTMFSGYSAYRYLCTPVLADEKAAVNAKKSLYGTTFRFLEKNEYGGFYSIDQY